MDAVGSGGADDVDSMEEGIAEGENLTRVTCRVRVVRMRWDSVDPVAETFWTRLQIYQRMNRDGLEEHTPYGRGTDAVSLEAY